MNLYSPKELTEFLNEKGFNFKKNLGQNFLINENTARKIALSSLQNEETSNPKLVIEIGPGAGSLTKQLSAIYDSVLAIEIDKFAIELLKTTLEDVPNVEVINFDALKFDYSVIPQKYPDYDYYVCANIPYCITSELIMTLLESKVKFKSLTFLVQKEAAERFTAPPKTPEYGSICVSASLIADSKKLFTVSPNNFIPKPKVDSAVIKFFPKSEEKINVCDRDLFSRIVKGSFLQRRKTLLNTLTKTFSSSFSKEEINNILQNSGITSETRGEALSLEEFIKLTNVFSERLEHK